MTEDSNTITDLAYNVAKHYHDKQTYGTGKPYVDYHLAQVVSIVRSFTTDKTVEVIAWLHDTIEDTILSKAGIQNSFGNYVADQVEILTRPKQYGTIEYREEQYQGQLKRATKDASLVKIADIISNLSNIGTYRGDRIEYAKTKLEELKICMDRLK